MPARLQPARPPPDRTEVIVALLRTVRAHRPEGTVLAVFALVSAAVVSVLDHGHHLSFAAPVAGLGGLLVLLTALWQRERRTAGALRQERRHFRSLLDSSPDLALILDGDLRITYASSRLAALLGRPAEQVVGLPVHRALHPDDAGAVVAALSTVAPREHLAVRTARVRHADGRWLVIEATVCDLRTDPDVGTLVLHCRDVTPGTPATVATELLELSLTDPVTGLPNRAALVRRLGAVQRTAHGAPHAIALIGVGGLDAGVLDPVAEAAVLRALTSRFTRSLRSDDWLARGTGGDFVVLVEGTVADAEVVAGRLIADVGPLITGYGRLDLTAVAGLAALSGDLDTGDALRRGDLALRSARAAGPGSVHRYDDALRSAEDRRRSLSADLEGALGRGELRLVFQPVVDAVLQRTVSLEALLRWRHPRAGDVPPAEFVPLAEESPLITELGRWVLREACSTVAGLGEPAVKVAVNVSARHVRSGSLVPDVITALEDSGLPAARLVVEITESVLLDDAHVIEDLAALRELGVRIAVDDFGTGWSSLAYLVGMPVDVLKMDRHFLAGVEHDPQARALCRGVLQLGRSLGLPVVVEGVTTTGQLAVLRDMGHRYLQGYAFSRPVEVEDLAGGAWRACAGAPLPAAP